MKKILVLAAALASPMVFAANMPDNVGDVTYLGNIVANSPMWQWTVNDYPGGRLDAKPSSAITNGGITTYPLAGQAFIAVSGYLPSGNSTHYGTSASRLGVIDKTTLSDGTGAQIANVANAGKGAVTFSIAANGTSASAAPVLGTLKITATELRGNRYINKPVNGSPNTKRTGLFGGTTVHPYTPGGSCFAGLGAYTDTGTAMISGTADSPVRGEQSATAFAAWLEALRLADVTGFAPKFNTFTIADSAVQTGSNNCAAPTPSEVTVPDSSELTIVYISAGHILELTPVALAFNTPITGAWNATLNVTAYQM